MSYEAPQNGFRTFLIVWVTQSISVFGSGLTFFSINIWLAIGLYPRPEQKSELAWALTALGICFAVATVFGAPIAGAWADRHDRKRIMLLTDLASGLISLVLMTLLLTGRLQLWSVLAISLLAATAGAFHNAAFDTSVSMLVPEAQLPRANGMMQTIFALQGILAPALAASLIALPALARQGLLPIHALARLADGMPLAVLVDAITFFQAAATLLFVRIPSPQRADLAPAAGAPRKSLLADVQEGALYIWRRRPMLWLLGTFTVANFAASPVQLFQPLLVKFTLAADWTARGLSFESALALLATLAALGGVAGGLFISAWGGLKRRRVYGVLAAMLVAASVQILLGFTVKLYLAAATLFIIDAMMPVMNAHSQAIWQTQTPREMQGRVFSVRRVIAQFSWPLSTVLAGWAGARFNPGSVLAVLGAVLLLFCVEQLFNPVLLRVEDKAYLDGLADAEPSAG